jgi:hypothetical protein
MHEEAEEGKRVRVPRDGAACVPRDGAACVPHDGVACVPHDGAAHTEAGKGVLQTEIRERYGTVTFTRHAKDDGRALLLYTHAENESV